MNQKKPTLLVLAAGMGSRYGKLKQLDSFGPNGETIIDYSMYDAIQAGFGKVVFVIREYFREEFEQYFRNKIEGKIEVVFVCQELDIVPQGAVYHSNREKPWGTAHAIWVAKDVINEPFGVINADDYYGVNSFVQLYEYLNSAADQIDHNYAVVGYYLRNTLSNHGTVNRGVCQLNEDGTLESITECVKIKRYPDGNIKYPDGDKETILHENTLVSMNMWGFMPSYFEHCTSIFSQFLANEGDKLTSEFYIPTLVDVLIKNETLQVDVLDTESDWFGVTYQEDKPFVIEKIENLIAKNVYPPKLWS